VYRTLFALLAVFAAAILLVGATFSSVREDRAEYVFVNGTEPQTLDPQKMKGVPEGRVADALFEGLTYRDEATLEPKAGSALRWEATPDGKRYTFHLRPEARWTDGEPVTAHDFAYAWKRLQEPAIASEYAYMLHVVRHAEAYNTYGAQIADLRGDPSAKDSDAATQARKRKGILAGLRELATGGRLPAERWQAFLQDWKVRDVVLKPSDRRILDAFDRRTGEFGEEEASGLLEALEADTRRREEALAAAKAHFGIDEGAFALDDRTFVVELNAYTPYFLDITAFHSTLPVPRRVVEKDPEDWFRPGKIVSNGPFRLEHWKVNQKIRLRRSESYWGRDEVHLETVDVLPLENQTTALNLYLTGEADWLPATYPPDLIDHLKPRSDFHANAALASYFFRINCTKKPFDDPRVRKALCLALDREQLVSLVTRKGEPPAYSIVPPGVRGYVAPSSGLRTAADASHLAEARRLLAEAGYRDGRGSDGKPLSFGVLYNDHPGHKKVAEWLADQYRKNLGVESNAYAQEWQAYLRSQTMLDYEVCRAGWVGDYNDPNTFLDLWVTKAGNNNTGWGDPTYDRLIALAADPFSLEGVADEMLPRLKEPEVARRLLDEVLATDDPAEKNLRGAALRMHLFREAEAILFQDAFPVIPLYFYVHTNMVAPSVEGFYVLLDGPDGTKVPNLQDLHPFRSVRVRRRGPSSR
jgi:oligopeptide transport system substrate-binding protein